MTFNGELCDETARIRFDEAATVALDTPVRGHYSGRGVVVCGGGSRYLPCVWVCINMLRHHGCSLPIELWYLGDRELPSEIRPAIEALGVCCVDAFAVRQAQPARILNGWELKPYAIIHSAFNEVLYIDCDNVCVKDPSFLFDAQPYLDCGAVFWPDFGRLGRERLVWRLTGVPYRDEPEFETGQILVNKTKSWNSLLLTMWMNEHSDFWFRHIHGDKETFHMAWRRLEKPYAMPNRPIEALSGTMCQHDFEGGRLFQHRNMKKWALSNNDRVPGFLFEDECLHYLRQLQKFERLLRGIPPLDPERSNVLANCTVEYIRVGYDRREMELLPDGRIGLGGDRMERFWGVRSEAKSSVLEFYGDDGLTARLVNDTTDLAKWKGFWLIHERMPIEVNVKCCTSQPPATPRPEMNVTGSGGEERIHESQCENATD